MQDSVQPGAVRRGDADGDAEHHANHGRENHQRQRLNGCLPKPQVVDQEQCRQGEQREARAALNQVGGRGHQDDEHQCRDSREQLGEGRDHLPKRRDQVEEALRMAGRVIDQRAQPEPERDLVGDHPLIGGLQPVPERHQARAGEAREHGGSPGFPSMVVTPSSQPSSNAG